MKKHLAIALALGSFLGLTVYWGVQYLNQGPRLGGDFNLIWNKDKFHFAESARDLNILYIGYAKCPDVCPMALSNTAQALKFLNSDERHRVQVLFISVDFAHDSGENVSTYAQQFDASFIGLTGSKEQIDDSIKLFGASYMLEENKKSYLGYSIAHTDRLYFLNKKGDVKDMISSPRSSEEILQKIKELL